MKTPEKESNQGSHFKEQMKKAFHHGRNFKLRTNVEEGELNVDTTPDENLPFSEWFNKHYKTLDENYGWFKVENGCPVTSPSSPEQKPLSDVVALLREFAMRGRYAIPETDQDNQWWEEGMKPELIEPLYLTLGLGKPHDLPEKYKEDQTIVPVEFPEKLKSENFMKKLFGDDPIDTTQVYGLCPHDENMATCNICNPYK